MTRPRIPFPTSILRMAAPVAPALVVALAAPATTAAGTPAQGASPGDANPLAGLRFFVDDATTGYAHPAWDTYRSLKRAGKTADAAAMLKLARQPQFRWFGEYDSGIRAKIASYYQKIDRLGQSGAVPLLTIFRHPHPTSADPNRLGRNKYNGKHYSFSAATFRRYDQWISDFADGIGRHRAVIAFEPDAFGSFIYLSAKGKKQRFDHFRKAITTLTEKAPNATIYIDAGASDWRPAAETAKLLNSVGIAKVRGFFLNATHFDSTAKNYAHGLKISKLTGGKPFIISTHANGNGSIAYSRSRPTVHNWCNPKNAALGTPPTVAPDPSKPKLDAYMWIGRAGYSAGRCAGLSTSESPGHGPTGGTWWPERALLLASRAKFEHGPLELPFGN